MNSIRSNLIAALIGAMFAAMFFGGWATYSAAHNEASDLFDYQLQQIALSLRDQTFQGSAEALANDESLDYVIRVWNQTGLTIYSSRRHQSMPELTRLGYSTADSGEGAWRIFAIQHHGMTIAVAQPMRVRNQLATDAAWRTLKPFLLLLPALALICWVLVSSGLWPLAQLAQSLKARSPESLDPLSEPNVPDEVAPLVGSLNDLLARLKIARDAQRAFVADAAHELRSPLTALQLQLQLVERAESEAARGEALADLKHGLQRTTHAVQQMLTLARQEPGAAEYVMAPVGLAALARTAVVDHERLAEAQEIDLGVTDADESAVVQGDADALRILLANLIGNALRYTPAGGRVDVACGHGEAGSYLEVVDTGPGIPAAERDRVFDRFYRRHGEGRLASDTRSGSGLGLSIVSTIASRHGATVVLSDTQAGDASSGLRVTVSFPRVGEQDQPLRSSASANRESGS
ncbi:MAG: ATP-binding protein [Propionivibrio sp.]